MAKRIVIINGPNLNLLGKRERIVTGIKLGVKSLGSTQELHLKLVLLSSGEESGIPGVAVKCVDIGKNTSGEGGSLA